MDAEKDHLEAVKANADAELIAKLGRLARLESEQLIVWNNLKKSVKNGNERGKRKNGSERSAGRNGSERTRSARRNGKNRRK